MRTPRLLEHFLEKRRVKKVPLKDSEFATLCPCGNALKGDVGRPKRFKESISRFTCSNCGSQFMAISKKVPGDPRRARTTFKILKLGKLAKQKLKERALS